jgi:threonine dehydrogenase
MVRSGRLNAKAMATHRFTFDQFEEAYDLFSHAAEHNVVKVVISRDPEVAA